MKSSFLGLLFLCVFATTNAQYIERFNNLIFSPTNSWSNNLPIGMSAYNLDGLQAAPQIASAFPNNAAWVTHIQDNDTFAVSHSWYEPAGISNDWLVTPPIYVPLATSTHTPFLIWKVKAPDINFPDGYKVKVSTAGNQPIDFTSLSIFEESAAPNEFTTRAISLGNYAGQTIYIAFVNESNDQFMLYLDDLEIAMLHSQPNITLTNSHANRITKVDTDTYISGTVTNYSAVVVNDLAITWTEGNNNHNMLLSGLNILPMQSYDFIHSEPFQSNWVDETPIALTVSTINGQQDADLSDNTELLVISTVAQDIPKSVVFEEVTGTWCGWCPRGIVSMRYMDSLYAGTEQFIGIAIHTQDTMAMDDYADSTHIHLIPRTNVDRLLFDQETEPLAYQSYLEQMSLLPPPASLDVAAIYQNQELWVQVQGNFETKMTTGLRFAVVLIEDDVHSEHSSFDQVNLYYYYGDQNPMGGFENLPDPVPASQMWYDHVARAMLGGYHGAEASVPPIVLEGTVAIHDFYYTLPSYVNPNHTKAIALLIDEQTGRIYNAKSVPLMPAATAVEESATIPISVFPNPSDDFVNVQFTTEKRENISIDLYNHLGQIIKSNFYPNCEGEQNISLDINELPSGTYLMGISMQGKSFWKHIIVR